MIWDWGFIPTGDIWITKDGHWFRSISTNKIISKYIHNEYGEENSEYGSIDIDIDENNKDMNIVLHLMCRFKNKDISRDDLLKRVNVLLDNIEAKQ